MNAKQTTFTSVSLLVLAVLFIALIMLSNIFLKGVRVDLTENNLYTLSDGAKNILSDIDEPINLYYFFSEQASRSIPTLRTYANRVQELLEEFALNADGKINLQIVDPVPFSEEEDRASQFGLQAIPIGNAGESIYFGLAGTNSIDGVEVIPFFQPDKESFLEYDLSKLVYNLAEPQKPVVGMLSSLPMSGGFDPMTRQPQQPWVIGEQIRQLFEVREVAADVERIDPDIDVLMLVHPKELSEQTLYAIDQFILAGGRALIFVDPHAEGEMPQGNPQMAMFAERSSDLSTLLDTWGVSVDSSKIVGDALYALQVNANPGQPPVRHVGIISVGQEAMTNDDVITGELSNVNLSMTGYIQRQDDAKVELTPLIVTSDNAMPIEAERVRFLPDPSELLSGFEPTGDSYTIAARLNGEVPSAFPDGAPAPAAADPATPTELEPAQPEADSAGDSADNSDGSEHLAQSNGPINVILVADTDILTDRLWVRVQNFFGQRLASAWANNGDFVINALDNLFGNSDLIGMRSRATSNRPFTTVQALEQQADARFRAKEQELEAQLQEAEQRINELQQQRGDAAQTDGSGALILTPEQRAEIERFQQRRLEIRQELRQVRRNLDQDIEQLGSWLKFINIGLVPIVITVVAVVIALLVRARRRRFTAAAAGA